MATVDRHPDSRFYRARFTGPDGKRICRTLKTEDRAVALKMAADLELTARQARAGILTTERGRAVVNEILTAAGQPPLEIESTRAFCERWLASKARTKTPSTIRVYRNILRDFLGHLGTVADRPLASILPRHIEGFRDMLVEAGRGPASLRKEVFQVSGIFGLAVRQGLIARNPAAMIELDNAAGQTREPFTAADVKALLSHAEGEWVTVILLGAYTGMRIGDAAGLSWEAVDLDAAVIKFTPQKTKRKGKVLTIPLHPTLEAHLGSIAGDVGGPVCPTLARVATSGLSQEFSEIMAAAGIRREAGETKQALNRTFFKKSFHSLRHFFNSALLAAGVDEKTRMDLSGHASSTMNRRYSHSELSTLREAVAKI